MKNKLNTFTGSIDDFLNHCSQLDISNLEEQLKDQEKEECLEVIMKEIDCSLEEAEQIYNEIALKEVQDTVDQLVAEGLLEISGYNEEGEPLFVLTELGKKVQEEIKKK